MSLKSRLIVSATAGFTALVALSWGCGNKTCVLINPDIICVPRPYDSTGYLKPICQYIVTHFESYGVEPNAITIERVVPGNDQTFLDESQYSTDEYDFVQLSCCSSGDWAVVEVASKTVVSFHPGHVPGECG